MTRLDEQLQLEELRQRARKRDEEQRDYLEKLEDEVALQREFIASISENATLVGVVTRVSANGSTFAEIAVGNQRYEVKVDKKFADTIAPGKRVVLERSHLSILDVRDGSKEGTVVFAKELLQDGRIKALVEGKPHVYENNFGIKKGDSLLVDTVSNTVLENLGKQNTGYRLETVPTVPWQKIGGLDEVIAQIQETIEFPILYSDLYAKYNRGFPKGILLYGPPGCGKTLMAKSIAYNLAKVRGEKLGKEKNGHFLSIKGPEILNMYVGNSEAEIRQIFESAREKSKEDDEPVIIFIDEAESILKKRGTGISTDVYDSIVPAFLAEMDGMGDNHNVIVVLSTNRPDILDPAILRPERIDRKIKVTRPNELGTKQIYGIHLQNISMSQQTIADAGIAGLSPIEYLATYASKKIHANEENAMALIHFKDETTTPIRYYHMISGAVIKSTVDRAIDSAIRRERDYLKQQGGLHGQTKNVTRQIAKKRLGLHLDDLLHAIDEEFKENSFIATNLLTTDDYKEIAGRKSDQIVKITSLYV